MTQQNVSRTCRTCKKLGITRIFKGSCNKNLFETWLINCLLPQLQPGDIIIDNASFHQGKSIRKIIEEAGCEVWYLPPCSPDFNIALRI